MSVTLVTRDDWSKAAELINILERAGQVWHLNGSLEKYYTTEVNNAVSTSLGFVQLGPPFLVRSHRTLRLLAIVLIKYAIIGMNFIRSKLPGKDNGVGIFRRLIRHPFTEALAHFSAARIWGFMDWGCVF